MTKPCPDGFPSELARYVMRGSMPIPATPTDARPGSPGKIEVMAERMARRQYLHHPDDAPLDRSIVLKRRKGEGRSSERTIDKVVHAVGFLTASTDDIDELMLGSTAR